MTKMRVLSIGLLAAGVLAVLAGRPWVEGSASSSVTGQVPVSVTGAGSSRLVVALALAGAAGLVVAATAGRVARLLGGLLALGSGLGALVMVVRVLLETDSVLADHARSRAGGLPMQVAPGAAQPTAWLWLAVGATVLLTVSGALALLAGSRWQGLSGRYSAPTTDGLSADGQASDGIAGRAGDDLWDSLTRGEDPT